MSEDCARPIIAISPQWEDEIAAFSCRARYVELLQHADATPFILAYDITRNSRGHEYQLLDLCDGLLLPGGADMHPSEYGESEEGSLGPFQPVRDKWEKKLVKCAIERDMPVLAICRGMQVANVVHGGKLIQDIGKTRSNALEHWQSGPYDTTSHSVEVNQDSLLFDILKERCVSVNSMHHQAVVELAAGLEVAAIAPDGVIEAAWRPKSTFFLALQWHPEYISETESSRKIARAFVEACIEYRDNGRKEATMFCK